MSPNNKRFIIGETDAIAIISDPHGNMSALEAVLEEISLKGIRRIFCLGDIVGYCGDTIRVVESIKAKAENSCLGNHEQGLKYALYFNATPEGLKDSLSIKRAAAESIIIAKNQIIKEEKGQELQDFLFRLQRVIRIREDAVGMHTTGERMEYAISKELAERYGLYNLNLCQNPEKVLSDNTLFERGIQMIFTGHVHIPVIYIRDTKGKVREFVPFPHISTKEDPKKFEGRGIDEYSSSDNLRVKFSKYFVGQGERALISVGAVGVSRKKDTRILEKAKQAGLTIFPAYFAVLSKNMVEFIEIYYDASRVIKSTQEAGMSTDIFS